MPTNLGTRTKQNFQHERLDQGMDTRTRNQDPGMSKYVSASLTLSTAGTITGANNTFKNAAGGQMFNVGDPVLIQLTYWDDSFYTVVGVDAANFSFLNLDPPPKNFGPATVVVRTP